MLSQLRPALVCTAMLVLLTGLAYPLALTGVAQVLFPAPANGSLIVENGVAHGSSLIGQSFDNPRYFWGRPSATTPMPYNAASSGASNWGADNPDLLKAVADRVTKFHAADPGNRRPVPVDLVTASASGLDPHISLAAAEYQVPRVAKARGLTEDQVRVLFPQAVQPRPLGILGEPAVNVLRLNLALDDLSTQTGDNTAKPAAADRSGKPTIGG
jgi:potassium-transporting ATPase KdpC subunit